MKSYYLGIDIGSTAVKAMLIDGETLTTAFRAGVGYSTKRVGGYVTQAPSDWSDAAASAVRSVIAEADNAGRSGNILGISLSAQGGSIFATDENYKPISDAVSWMDARAAEEARELQSRFGEGVYLSSGWRLSPLDDASKLLWLKKHDSALFRRAAHYLTTADYYTGHLCGRYVYDPASAAITRLYDFMRGECSRELLEYLDIDAKKISPVMPSGTLAGTLTKDAADELGLDPGIPVYVGAHDQYCAAVGSGIRRPGQLLIATGTAWVLFGVTREPCFSPLHTAPCVFPELSGGDAKKYGVIATLSGIGASVERFAASCGYSLAESDRLAAALLEKRPDVGRYVPASPCEEGRGFLPHRAGTGITYDPVSGKDYAARYLALLEGAAFEALAAAEKLPLGAHPSVVMSGGAARSALWRGIVASAAASRGMTLELAREKDAPAFGAALIAAAGSGRDIMSAVGETETVPPVGEYAAWLGEAYLLWKKAILSE